MAAMSDNNDSERDPVEHDWRYAPRYANGGGAGDSLLWFALGVPAIAIDVGLFVWVSEVAAAALIALAVLVAFAGSMGDWL